MPRTVRVSVELEMSDHQKLQRLKAEQIEKQGKLVTQDSIIKTAIKNHLDKK